MTAVARPLVSEPDRVAAEAMWEAYATAARGGRRRSEPAVEHLVDLADLGGEFLGLVLAGGKRAALRGVGTPSPGSL